MKKVDYTGSRYGNLTAVELIDFCVFSDGREYQTWKFRCDCGKFTNKAIHVAAAQSRRKKPGYPHCGCAKKTQEQVNETAFRDVVRMYRVSAIERGLEYGLSDDDCREMFSRQCCYCGAEPGKIKRVKRGIFVYNGIDRIDNDKGYVLGNVATCCSMCNRMKLTFSVDQFLSKISEIYNHSILNKST